MSSPREPRTAAYILAGTWPDATLRPDAPAHIERVQTTCRRLRDYISANGESVRAVAARAGVSHTTVTRVLRGEAWCDIATLTALEDALGVNVWAPRDGGRDGKRGGGTQK